MVTEYASIPGFPGFAVNRYGDVRPTSPENRVHIGSSAYALASFSTPEYRKSCVVHRLVAFAFLPNPDNKPLINHIDGNKRNNALENLEWCTQRENVLHAYKTGLNPGRKGKVKHEEPVKSVKTIADVIASPPRPAMTGDELRKMRKAKKWSAEAFAMCAGLGMGKKGLIRLAQYEGNGSKKSHRSITPPMDALFRMILNK